MLLTTQCAPVVSQCQKGRTPITAPALLQQRPQSRNMQYRKNITLSFPSDSHFCFCVEQFVPNWLIKQDTIIEF